MVRKQGLVGYDSMTADNRVPPRGTVGEPRHISSMNANLVSTHARNKSAASKPFDRPRDSVLLQDQNTSEKKQNRRGKRSNEAGPRRIEQRKQKRIESMRLYWTFRETTPREEWRLARPTHRDSTALKAGGTDKNKTWGSRHWKKNWHSKKQPVKYYDETSTFKCQRCERNNKERTSYNIHEKEFNRFTMLTGNKNPEF